MRPRAGDVFSRHGRERRRDHRIRVRDVRERKRDAHRRNHGEVARPERDDSVHSLRRGESIQTKTRPRRETPPRVPGILESSKQRPKTRKQIGTKILSVAVQKTLDSVLLRHRRVYALRRKRRDARERPVVRLRVRVLNAAAARAHVVGRLTRVDTHFCVSSRIETNNNVCYLVENNNTNNFTVKTMRFATTRARRSLGLLLLLLLLLLRWRDVTTFFVFVWCSRFVF